jgi:hypothetical protein
MITKLQVLGFSLVTALSVPALAHDQRHGAPRAPTSYEGSRHGGPHHEGPRQWGPRDDWRRDRGPRDIVLTGSDINRDGWVSLEEALDHGRSDFRRSDRNHDRVLNRREMDRSEIARHDRNGDGRMSFIEHQRAVRRHFERLDRNRDGYLARYELDSRYGAPGRSAPGRSVGWSPGWRR